MEIDRVFKLSFMIDSWDAVHRVDHPLDLCRLTRNMESSAQKIAGEIYHDGMAGPAKRGVCIYSFVVHRTTSPFNVAVRDHQHDARSDLLYPAFERLYR